MPKATETTLEIDLKALQNNFDELKSKLQPKTKFLAVVKAFSYGNDSVPIAQYLQKANADYFAVAYTNEGEELRNNDITKPILVLHPQKANLQTLLNRRLEPSIYSKKTLLEFISIAENSNQNAYPIHLKFNTGLNRLGFDKIDIDFIIETLAKTNAVKVVSCFSHLAASEDLSEQEFTKNQINLFKDITSTFITKLGYKPILHLCNTSGILNYPEAHFDMVRSGIGLYGFGNDVRYQPNFTPIATLKTVISQIHILQPGDSLGYNRGLITDKEIKTATLPIGHADGLTRIYGKGKGFVFVNGKKAPIVGNVCMDMVMVDVTHIDCNEGDEVIVFDREHTAENLAEAAGTISYELITDLSKRIKRVFLT
ncbi:alanine racemase [Pustulibacterium marinum]|uniref:Alanine racemase n=1 Tax=Pustulibacterium marinum TaxID=1224947 RepID=A0A1I7EUN2_9FLAO|nr:alanine racemase [Pustulibacterium marinum]SFU27631.1 alanine racemase [Pustulibacterium marinum]